MAQREFSQGNHGGASPRAVPRRPVPRDLDAAMALLSEGPCVVTGALSASQRAPLTLARLLAEQGAARVPVAPVRDGQVVLDPRRGLGTTAETFEAFARGVGAGEPRGYLCGAARELPPGLAGSLPAPSFAAAAPWCVTKLWVGDAGIVSALHRDLSHNAHTVIEGRKRFWLASPAHDADLYPAAPWSSMPNGCEVDPEAPDLSRHPRFARVRALVAELGPGDTLLLPGRWWHHVRILKPCVSVNSFFARGAHAAVAASADALKRLRGLNR